MARERGGSAARGEEAPSPRENARNAVATLALAGTVVCVLLAGLALRSAPPEPEPPPPPRPSFSSIPVTAPPLPPRETPQPVQAPSERPAELPPPTSRPAAAEPKPSAAGDDLGARASSDATRLARASGRYTAQLAVACSLENVRRALKKAGPSRRVYVLAAPERGNSCYRICYGDYATAKEAAAAADLPAALRQIAPRPVAKPVAEVAR